MESLFTGISSEQMAAAIIFLLKTFPQLSWVLTLASGVYSYRAASKLAVAFIDNYVASTASPKDNTVWNSIKNWGGWNFFKLLGDAFLYIKSNPTPAAPVVEVVAEKKSP